MGDANDLKKELADVLSHLKRNKRPFPVNVGIAPGEFFVLGMIERFQDVHMGGIKASTIGEVSHMSRPGVSQMLKTLEKKNLIKRVMAEEDRRVVLVCLTDSGKEVLRKSKKSFLAMVDRVYEDFGEEDTKKFIELLNRFQTIFFDEESYQANVD